MKSVRTSGKRSQRIAFNSASFMSQRFIPRRLIECVVPGEISTFKCTLKNETRAIFIVLLLTTENVRLTFFHAP